MTSKPAPKSARVKISAIATGAGAAISITNAAGETEEVSPGHDSEHYLRAGDTITITIDDLEERAAERAAREGRGPHTAAEALSPRAEPVAQAVADETATGGASAPRASRKA